MQRDEGEATVHPSTVLHAVTCMTSGTRYSLIVFFHEAAVGAPSAASGADPNATNGPIPVCENSPVSVGTAQ